MRILIAEDDAVSRTVLCTVARKTGDEVVQVANGDEAWRVLSGPDAPEMAILDWLMPGADGLEVIRRARSSLTDWPPHIILLTSRNTKADTVVGLDAGADDYLVKPYNMNELRARIEVGRRMIEQRRRLKRKSEELKLAMGRIRTLRGIVPICANCKKIRDDQGYWNQVEVYVRDHTEAEFSHGICPGCIRELYPELDASEYEDLDGPPEQ